VLSSSTAATECRFNHYGDRRRRGFLGRSHATNCTYFAHPEKANVTPFVPSGSEGHRAAERDELRSPALIQSIGAILAVVGAAYLATRSYRAQKDANRDAELENQKAESYVRFLNSYWDMTRWDVAKSESSTKYDQDEHSGGTTRVLEGFQ
jgi:hypothetical protein